MTKSVFKSEYSAFRNSARVAHGKGLESFRIALNKDVFLQRIYLNRDFILPTSLKIWAYKNKKSTV